MKTLTLFTMLLFVLLFTGCGITGVKPKGFAEYKKWYVFDHKSISAEGVVFKVKKFKAKPQASIHFWKEAIVDQMTNSGYVFVDSASITTHKYPGAWVEFAVPLGQEDYSYIVAVFNKKKKIYLIETAGEVSGFQKRKKEILEAIGKIDI